ncbi:MAG: RNA 2',3'-cyclic phosphodiesterase [Candidatus Liptonbacteria bacterium]|nr:RNA 2',3'-cyclic phosphodiesterase [Candidatus Liptonbacteria bacterium]
MRRIFVALKISPKLQQCVAEWAARHYNFPVRWLAGKNLHITLIPPWHATDENIESTKEILENITRSSSPFPLLFHTLSFGPDPRRPRLIWAEGNAPRELLLLKSHLDIALGPAEKRPFRLHLTLARFREEEFAHFPIKSLHEQVNWNELANSLVLMESHLSPHGADYEILAEFLLQPHE